MCNLSRCVCVYKRFNWRYASIHIHHISALSSHMCAWYLWIAYITWYLTAQCYTPLRHFFRIRPSQNRPNGIHERWIELNDLKNCVCKRIRDYKFLRRSPRKCAHMREMANGKTVSVDARIQERICVRVCLNQRLVEEHVTNFFECYTFYEIHWLATANPLWCKMSLVLFLNWLFLRNRSYPDSASNFRFLP